MVQIFNKLSLGKKNGRRGNENALARRISTYVEHPIKVMSEEGSSHYDDDVIGILYKVHLDLLTS